MDIPHHGLRSVALSQFHVHDSSLPDQYQSPSRLSFNCSIFWPLTSSEPMPLPNMRDPIPPPLPPPRHLADMAGGGDNSSDVAWQSGSSRVDNELAESSLTLGSNLYVSYTSRRSIPDEQPGSAHRACSSCTIKQMSGHSSRDKSVPRIEEEYPSLAGFSIDSYRSVNLSLICK
jgi:hypothetical protein